MTKAPIHCHPAAWDAMRAILPVVETNAGLLGGAVAIAMHADPLLDTAAVARRIDDLVAEVRARAGTASPRGIVAHAHQLLFTDLGFRGDPEDYYEPSYSFLPRVLERRRGLPITLCLVLKLVVEPLGPRVHGVNSPGHFLARIEAGPGFVPMLVDPFAGGRVLTVPEAIDRVHAAVGRTFDVRQDPLPLATHRDWLQRMLRNLIGVYHRCDRPEDRAAMEELSRLLRGD